MRLTVILLFICLHLGWGIHASAQERILGKVLSKTDNTPLIGANVVVIPSYKGTITDSDGNFEIVVSGYPLDSLKVMVSFIGMETVTVPAASKGPLTIWLEDKLNELMQVVITSSYGTKSFKEEVVGSISTIQSKDIQVTQAFESVDKMLEGQIAGVNIEAGPGVLEPAKITIRGQGSLTPIGNALLGTSTQPLIIIDGVIMSEEMAIDNSFFDGTGTAAENFGNPLGQLAPEDIESINVLKDAAAVSLYGADGANGVVIITTKKGRKGRMNYNFSTQFGLSQAINRIKYLDGPRYNELRNAYLVNEGQNPIPYNGVDTDWYDLLNQDGFYNKYALDASGGGEHLTYRIGLNYLRIDEAQRGNGSDQYRMSMNLGYSNDKMTLNFTLNPSITKKIAPNVYYAYAFVPTIAPYNADGSYAPVGVLGLGNPLAAIEQNHNESLTRGAISSLDWRYHLTSALDFFTSFGLDYKDKEQDRYWSGENESGQFNGTFELNGVTYNRWGRRVINERHSVRWNWQGQFAWSKEFLEHHSLDGLAGMELAEEQVDFDYASGIGFVNPNVMNPVSAALRDDDPETSQDETFNNQTYDSDINYNSRVSLFGQLNYDYKKKYFFLANMRRDQSSVFGDDTDVALNGGAGVSWILSKEPFLGTLSARWLDFLRLRVSYGTTGNSRIGSYTSKGLYTFSEVGGYNGLPYAFPQTAPNPRLTWETNKKFNVGFDLNFLTRFNITLEYFYDQRNDLITSRNIPTETGYSSVQINGSDMYNKGVELFLRAQLVKTNLFNWSATFNYASLQSKVTSITGFGDSYSLASRALALKEGYSTSTLWGVRWAGIDPATGRDLVLKDGQIYDAATYRSLFGSTDWEPIGNSQPDFYGGFSTSLTFKGNLTLAIRGSYKYGADKLVDYNLISNYNITSNRNLSVNAWDYWREPGDVALLPAVSRTNPLISNLSRFLYDTSHLKLNNISLSYRLPVEKWRLGIKNVALNADVSNVWYFYKEKSPDGRNGIRELMHNYPEARTYSLGLKMNF